MNPEPKRVAFGGGKLDVAAVQVDDESGIAAAHPAFVKACRLVWVGRDGRDNDGAGTHHRQRRGLSTQSDAA